jgi:hypothetical protein
MGLQIAVWLWVASAVGAVFLTTLGTDEAWVLSGLRSYLRPPVLDLSTPPVSTSGGVFAIANIALEAAFGSSVAVHRLFSLACLVALVVAVALAGRGGGRRRFELLAIAPLLAVPGTAEVGTTALGTSAALLLAVLATAVWCRAPAPGPGRAVAAGLLFGLAAATRFDLVLFAPALLLVSGIVPGPDGRLRLVFPWAALLATAVGGAVFLANQVLMTRAAHAVLAAQLDAAHLASVAGVQGSLLDYPRLLNRLAIAIGLASPGLLVLAASLAFWSPEDAHDGSLRRAAILLVTLGAATWAAWVLRAPIPHLRYLWPSLALFAVAGGLGLPAIHRTVAARGDAWKGAALYLIALGLVLGGIGGTFRSLVAADSDATSWEWSRETGMEYFRRFEAAPDQRAAAAFVRTGIPADATVLSYVPFPLRYLAERPIADVLSGAPPALGGETYLVLTPMVGSYLYLRPEAWAWIAEHGILVAQFGRYSVYRLPGGPPGDASLLALPRTNYERHPSSRFWFGRTAATRPGVP